MKSFILSLVLILVTGTSAFAQNPCSSTDPQYRPIADRGYQAVFFRLEQCGLAASHILGTVHSDDPKITNTIVTPYTSLKDAHIALFELGLDQDIMTQAMRCMLLPQGKSLKHIIGEANFAALLSLVQVHIPQMKADVFNRYQPWAAAITVTIPPPTHDGVVLDDKLQRYAENNKIRAKGLETVSEQFKTFTEMTSEESLAMIKDTIRTADTIDDANNKMIQFYIEGDLLGLQEYSEEWIDLMSNQALKTRIKDRLIDTRNQILAERSLPHLTKGNTFIAVGALHLSGEGGMLERFEKAGYAVYPLETQ